MPKIVDHDERRLELVDATWRIIARLGIEGATMREIATEAGFANGALKPYFPTRDTLLDVRVRPRLQPENRAIVAVTEANTGWLHCGRSAWRCFPWTRSASTKRGS